MSDPSPETSEEAGMSAKEAIIYYAIPAMHSFEFGEKSFAPRRNERLLRILGEFKANFPRDPAEEIFKDFVARELENQRDVIRSGKIRLKVPHLRWGEFEGITINIDQPDLRNRTVFWNQRTTEVANKAGIMGLVDDQAAMLLTLGMSYWLDVGNLMVEIGRVGNRLKYEGSAGRDLEAKLGVTGDDWALFSHIKHSNGPGHGLYGSIYSTMLDNTQHLDLAAYLKSYERIAALMSLNHHFRKIVSPGSWFFDRQLAVIDPRFAWVPEIAGRTVDVGYAKDIAVNQLEFALATSQKRRDLHAAGKYEPIVTARVITLEEIQAILSRKDALLEKYSN